MSYGDLFPRLNLGAWAVNQAPIFRRPLFENSLPAFKILFPEFWENPHGTETGIFTAATQLKSRNMERNLEQKFPLFFNTVSYFSYFS